MILITAPCHQVLVDTFLKHHQVIYEPTITLQQLHEKIKDVQGLVVTTRLKIDAAVLDKAHKLKWIGRLGSGMELIDVSYAEKKNIVCISTPQGNAQAVAEHTIGMLLTMMNNIPKSFAEIKKHQWIRDANRGEEIQNKIVGVIGYGNTGQAFARSISGFLPQKILVYDKYKTGFGAGLIVESELNDVLQQAHILSINLPLTSETKHFVNEQFFQKIKQPIYFINASRGEIVRTQDLLKALSLRLFKGVLLDVLENEKIDQLDVDEKKILDELLMHHQVLLTPHIAGYTHEAYFKMSAYLLEGLVQKGLIHSIFGDPSKS